MNVILTPTADKRGKNLLTSEALQELRTIEAEITTRERYSEFCTLAYGPCSMSNPSQTYRTSSDCCVQVSYTPAHLLLD